MGISQYSTVRIRCYLSNRPRQCNKNELIVLFALLKYDTAFSCGLALEEVNRDNIVLYTQSKRTYAIDLVINLECFRRGFCINRLYVEVFVDHCDNSTTYLYESTQLPRTFVMSQESARGLLSASRPVDNLWLVAKRAMFDPYCRVEDLSELFSISVLDKDLDLIDKFTLVKPKVPDDYDKYEALNILPPAMIFEGPKHQIRELLLGECKDKTFLQILEYGLHNEFKQISLDELGRRIQDNTDENCSDMDEEMYSLLLPPLRPFVQRLKKNPKLRDRIRLLQLLNQGAI